MPADEFDELLWRADEAAPPPNVASDLAQRVFQEAGRQRRIRAVTLVALGLAVTAPVILLHLRAKPDATANPSMARASPEPLHEELARLEAEAALHQRIADELIRIEARERRLQLLARQAAVPDPIERVEEARDRAARILMHAALRMRASPQEASQAREMYRDAARLFPETPAVREWTQEIENRGV